ncbi:MAG TPA: competence protein CoiA family protein [Bacillales bacterium]|nr:competence protein CoiA family protein [Bacillales bacterium]
MLTAITKSGKKLSLGYEYKKETLLYLRTREEFFCPVCGEKVALKLGDKRIFHFAHQKGGSCRDFFENETQYHMKGKLQLYQWLKNQKISCELEYYDKEIRQCPDILFIYHGKKFALEYQCSIIPEEVFTKRTENYLQHGYTPLWILGGNHFKPTNHGTVSLTNFHYLFLRRTSEGYFYLPYYFSDQKIFQLLYSIFPFSTKNAKAKTSLLSLDKIHVSNLVEPKVNIQLNIKAWKQKLELYQMHWAAYPNPKQKNFLNELYNLRMNLFLLPPEIGLPVTHSWLIQTPAFIWQTYLYLDILSKRHPGDFISLREVEKSFRKRIMMGQIQIRNAPQEISSHPFQAVKEYVAVLKKCGVLEGESSNQIKFRKKIIIPLTNREKEELTQRFFRENAEILFEKI